MKTIADEDIDTSDIPEAGEEFFRKAKLLPAKTYAVVLTTPKTAPASTVSSGFHSVEAADEFVLNLYLDPSWEVGTRWKVCEETGPNQYRRLRSGTK